MVLAIHAHYYAAHESSPSLLHDLEDSDYFLSAFIANGCFFALPHVHKSHLRVILVYKCSAMYACRSWFSAELFLSAHVYYKKATIIKMCAGQKSEEG